MKADVTYLEYQVFVLQYLFSFSLIVILNVFTVSDIRAAWKDASKICNMILRFPLHAFHSFLSSDETKNNRTKNGNMK